VSQLLKLLVTGLVGRIRKIVRHDATITSTS